MGDAHDESRPQVLTKQRRDPAAAGPAIFITIPVIHGLLLDEAMRTTRVCPTATGQASRMLLPLVGGRGTQRPSACSVSVRRMKLLL